MGFILVLGKYCRNYFCQRSHIFQMHVLLSLLMVFLRGIFKTKLSFLHVILAKCNFKM